MLTSDNCTVATNLLTLALDQLKVNTASIDELITNNLQSFIDANLNQHSNSATDAKHAVAIAFLGTNPDNFNKIKVKLGIGKKYANTFFIQIMNQYTLLPLIIVKKFQLFKNYNENVSSDSAIAMMHLELVPTLLDVLM